MDDKEFTPESIRMRANEVMLNSKGFILCAVDRDGALEVVADTTCLNPAEIWGLDAYRKSDEVEP